jgi:hypothetical protein
MSGGDLTDGLTRYVFEAGPRPVPPPVARERERIKSNLRAAFPHQSARIRHRFSIRHRFTGAGEEPIEPSGIGEEAETLLTRIELHLELLARAAESIRPEALARPTFHGMPVWYPHLLASYLRIPLTRAECDLITGLDRKRTPIPEIGDRVARARVDALGGLLPRLVDASKSHSYARLPDLYARLPDLQSDLLGVMEDLADVDSVDRSHESVRPDETPTDGRPEVAGLGRNRRDASGLSPAARAPLVQVPVKTPDVLNKDAPKIPPNIPVYSSFRILGEIPTVLHEVDREVRLPGAGRWTEPLLALIAQTQQSTRSPGAPGRD